jgi:septal ring factor EnvC (AmiA/AmiB activator)
VEGTPPPTPAAAEPPPGHPDEEALPATLAEVRTLRRWLAVAGVWAVAASAIAIIALLEATKEDKPAGPRKATASELARVQRDLNKRIHDLESQVQGLPRSSDVRKLENRLKKVEDQAADTRAAAKKLGSDLDDLQGRVDDLEQQSTTTEPGANTDTTPQKP